MHEFFSSVSNLRTDEYGGSFENRVRLPLEVIRAVRAVMPKDMPLVVRISSSDWLSEGQGWDIQQSIEFVRRLSKEGVDLVEASSGGNHKDQNVKAGPGYQVPFAEQLKKNVPEMLIGAVGMITKGRQAEEIIEKGQADVVLIAREFLRNGGLVQQFARDLGVEVQKPKQYHRS